MSFLVNCYALCMSHLPARSASLEAFGFDGAGSVIYYTHLVAVKKNRCQPKLQYGAPRISDQLRALSTSDNFQLLRSALSLPGPEELEEKFQLTQDRECCRVRTDGKAEAIQLRHGEVGLGLLGLAS